MSIRCYKDSSFYNNIKDDIIESFDLPTGHERPFVNVFDDKKKQIKIILLSHPLTRDSSYEQYLRYKNDGFLILGITSYSEFPSVTTNTLDGLSNPNDQAYKYDYMELVDGWLYCFRDPDKYISDTSLPKLLLSESDFTNYDHYKPDKSVEKIYDFIYLCPKDDEHDEVKSKECYGWVATNKNWKLARECLQVLCNGFGLKGFLVGREGCDVPEGCENYIETAKFLNSQALLKKYRQSKFIFVPNQIDASPRVLTEAMCTDLPILVNYNILGGWKYVDQKSGAFFTSKDDIGQSIRYILKNYNTLTPRQHYLDSFSKKVSGKKFKEFVQQHFSDKIDVSSHKYISI